MFLHFLSFLNTERVSKIQTMAADDLAMQGATQPHYNSLAAMIETLLWMLSQNITDSASGSCLDIKTSSYQYSNSHLLIINEKDI